MLTLSLLTSYWTRSWLLRQSWRWRWPAVQGHVQRTDGTCFLCHSETSWLQIQRSWRRSRKYQKCWLKKKTSVTIIERLWKQQCHNRSGHNHCLMSWTRILFWWQKYFVMSESSHPRAFTINHYTAESSFYLFFPLENSLIFYKIICKWCLCDKKKYKSGSNPHSSFTSSFLAIQSKEGSMHLLKDRGPSSRQTWK